ncbi:hypothetical protein [Comamonas fluminis]|uniref:hypothetical protein n=1 Tax=Comamonas fluminis TaxID=2796366 RepID=UPI001C488118|nr:hypothetical protein [Comamonas fluminis]
MLTRRAPMNPGKGFKSRGGFAGAGHHGDMDEGHAYEPGQPESREQRLAERAARQLAAARATADLITVKSRVVMGPAATGIVIEKDNAVESEPYRRLVAQLPCLWCGVEGYSQHAHLNYGKGLGMKTDDRTGFPLCCSRPGIEGCHVAYDQYRLLESGGREAHREYGLEAGRFTREQILNAGLWPRRLPLWAQEA